MPSFDTVCEPNMVEVRNAVDTSSKEIGTRFDFKGTSAALELKDKEITMFGDADFQLTQVEDIHHEFGPVAAVPLLPAPELETAPDPLSTEQVRALRWPPVEAAGSRWGCTVAPAGAASRTTCALVPPMPNELTPARRGPCHGSAAWIRRNGVRSISKRGLARSAW